MKFCESELGISSERGSMLYTYMAISYFFSNHLFCKLSEFKFINIFDLYQFSTTCLGVCLFLLPVATSYKAVVVLSVMFGLMDGGRYGLMPLIVLTCVGQKRIDQAWGYLTLFVGLSSVIGPVFIGKLFFVQEFTNKQNSPCNCVRKCKDRPSFRKVFTIQ